MGITLRAFSREIGVSLASVRRGLERGRIVAEPDGTIDPVKGRRDWEANRDPTKDHDGGSESNGDGVRARRTMQNARAAREAIQARIAELEFQRMTGEVVSAERVRRAAFTAGRVVRDQLKACAPRIAAAVTGMTEQVEVQRVIDAEHARVCELLAQVIAEFGTGDVRDSVQ